MTESQDGQILDFPFPPGPHGAPPPRYAELREGSPVLVRTPAGAVVHLALRADDIRAVYEDRRFSRNLRVPGAPKMLTGSDLAEAPDTLSNLDGADHRRLRKLAGAAFAPRRAESWRQLAEKSTHDFVDSLTTCSRPADLMRMLAFPLPVRIICRILGIPEDDAPLIRAWSDTMLSVSFAGGEARTKAGEEFAGYVADTIAWYREYGADDTLLADLIAAVDEDGDRLSHGELVSTVLTLVLAGHETTANVIGRGVLSLLRVPGGWALLRDHPERIPATVEEILRLEVPGHGAMLRLATEDVVLPSGAVIPRGEAVLAPTVAFNHDPAVFSDPAVLDLERDAAGHLTLGHGVHYCLGAPLARIEVQAALGVLSARIPTLRLAVDPDRLRWTTDSKVCGPLELPVTW